MTTSLVESLIFEHQAECYQAIQESTQKTDSAPFIAFMLQMILDSVTISAPQVGELLAAIRGEMGREALQAALGLSDRQILPRALPQTGAGQRSD